MRRVDNLTTLNVPIVLKSGSLNLLEPSGPVKACKGIALPLTLCKDIHRLLFYVHEFPHSCYARMCIDIRAFVFLICPHARSYPCCACMRVRSPHLSALALESVLCAHVGYNPCSACMCLVRVTSTERKNTTYIK